MNVKLVLCTGIVSIICLSACKKNPTSNPQDEMLTLNQLQVIASHNSYHKKDTSIIFSFLDSIKNALPPEDDPKELDYGHLPFDEQMNNYPVRGLEIDIYNDPQGGAFYNRKINSFIDGLSEASGVPELQTPGFKVLHIKDVDYNSTYNTFKQALTAVKTWSDQHPNHLPLFINIETKEDGPSQNPTLAAIGFLPPPPFNAAAADAFDEEIKSVFGPNMDQVLTPDRIRNGLPTLNAVVTQHKWPKLKDCRGKVVFIMEGNCVPYYKAGHPSLTGRAAFIYADLGTPEAAFLIRNDAVPQQADITARVAEGYIVRTRSDAGTIEARSGDYSSMNAGFTSGANIISTDYYKPDARGSIPGSGWTNFQVKFPNGEIARKNPVSADTVNVDVSLKE
ncbi:MAG: hypothetical protein JWO03_4090 [Bacteroidetes bacterium]|nr:hypothetical protein [Bacteroidota bacterium]